MFPISSVLLLSCLFHLALSFSPEDSGDAYVILYQNNRHKTTQLKLSLGDQFLVDSSLRKLDGEKNYHGIRSIKITQSFNSLSGVRNVTLGFEWVFRELFKLTSVSPAIQVNGKSQNVVLASQNKCFTGLEVRDSSDDTLPNRIIRKMILTPLRDYSGRRIEISPFLTPRKEEEDQS